MNPEVYKKVDDFLKSVKAKGSNVLGKLEWDDDGKMAKHLMTEYKLILWSGELKPVSPVNLSPLGDKVVTEYGGIENYLNSRNEKAKTKENLEFEKLKGEVEKLKHDIKISQDTPKNNRINRALSIIAIILSALSIIASLWLSMTKSN